MTDWVRLKILMNLNLVAEDWADELGQTMIKALL